MSAIGDTLALALQQHQAGRLHQAEELYRRILLVNPYHPDALHLLGVAISQMGRNDLAIDYIEQALTVKPEVAAFHNNLGFSYQALGRLEEAALHYRQAIQLQADFAMAHNNLGNVHRAQGRVEDAAQCYRQAIMLQPDYTEAHNNFGVVLQELGKLDEALACYEQALLLNPDHADTHLNRGMLWLARGDWERGWPEFEWRWKTKDLPGYGITQPRWDGSDLHGRTIFIYAEQGLGDTIHFIRYLPFVKRRGGQTIVECQAPLVRLLADFPGIDCLVPRGSPWPSFDVHLPLLSLPGIFNTSLGNIPGDVPYLPADSRLVEHWQRELESVPGFKVGIAWQGNVAKPDDAYRSIPLANFARLARVPGVQLVSLQKGPGADHLRSLEVQFPVLDLSSRLDEANGAFMDSAALMQSLDLVISSDTAVPHLAGALAIPVWVALPLSSDWRWLRDREDSPWYPTMRLFRQSQHGQWEEVFERIAESLVHFSARL